MLITKDSKQLKKAFRKAMSLNGMTISDVAVATGLNDQTVRNVVQAKLDKVNILELTRVAFLFWGVTDYKTFETIVKNA